MQTTLNPIDEYINELVDERIKTIFPNYDLEVRGNIKTLMSMTKMGDNFCRDVLIAFREQMDDKTGGFVTYDQSKYTFDKRKMKEWLENNQWIYGDNSWRPGVNK